MKPIKILASLLIFIRILISPGAFCLADENDTEIGYRVKPLTDRLASLSQSDRDRALSRFSDMKKHWSREYIGKLAALEIISGMPDGTFKPDNPLRVDEFIKMTVCAMGLRPGTGSQYWAEPYINAAVEYGLIGKDEFDSYTREITRQEMAKIIVLATLLKEPAPDSGLDELAKMNIRDFAKIGDAYKQYVITAYRMGIVTGTPEGFFNPGSTLTRGEAGAVILRNLSVVDRKPFKAEEGFAIDLTNSRSGERAIICRPEYREEIRVAHLLKNSADKSRGFLGVGYNLESGYIGFSLYESEAAFKKNFIENTQASIGIHINSDCEFPYNITIYDPDKTKELHRQFYAELFRYLFEHDSNKAMAQFDKYLELYKETDEYVEDSYYFNNRKFIIYKPENDKVFSIWIYSKS